MVSSEVLPLRRTRPGTAAFPGEAGVWVLIGGELLIFALLFGAFVVTWGDHPEDFRSAGVTHEELGAANTVVLLTSSLFAALAANAARAGATARARRLVLATAAMGVVFAVVKGWEYSDLLGNGFMPTTDSFAMYYYVLTGLHLLHVAIGLLVLAFVVTQLQKAGSGVWAARHVGSGISYWHMVDLIWVLLFPLLYLAAR